MVLTISLSCLKVVSFALDPALSSAEERWGEFSPSSPNPAVPALHLTA